MTDPKKYPEKTSERLIHEKLNELIPQVKAICFTNTADATDEEALGIIVSKYCEWDSIAIEEVTRAAYEDSNMDFSHI
jgi:hypothetical protein